LDEGYLREIIVEAGSSAKVNQLIAFLTDEADDDYADDLAEAQKESDEAISSGSEAPVAEAPAPVAAPVAPPVAPVAPVVPSTPVFTAPVASPVQVAPTAVANTRVKATPVAKKIAEERGINLAEVAGTGPSGRITKMDVLAYQPAAAAAAAAPVQAASKPNPGSLPATYGSLAPVLPTQDIPLPQMQKVVGQRLLQAQSSAPEFFVSMKIQVDALNSLRKQLNQTPGYRISINDMIIKAVAMNLRQFPVVNSYFMGETIRQNGNIDICMAVAIDGGLITPMIKDADHKPLGIISAEAKSLIKKAKTGTLAPEEFQGGTFTISNMGMFGVSEFTSIINPPQSAILAVAGVQEELYRKDDGEISAKNMMTVTLTSDHRVINGAVAAEFVNGLKSILENPACMML
jgi:pyruvate dehydrogenase E2 component (dihydrolipoamide acetyltransferase)